MRETGFIRFPPVKTKKERDSIFCKIRFIKNNFIFLNNDCNEDDDKCLLNYKRRPRKCYIALIRIRACNVNSIVCTLYMQLSLITSNYNWFSS